MKLPLQAARRLPFCMAAAVGFLACALPAEAADVSVGLAPASGPPFLLPGALRQDTLLHMLGGFSAGMMSAALIGASDATMRGEPLYLPAVSLVAATDAGLAKEIVDSTGFADPEWRDAVNTVIGGVIAGLVLRAIESTVPPSGGGEELIRGTSAALGIAAAVPLVFALAGEIRSYENRGGGEETP